VCSSAVRSVARSASRSAAFDGSLARFHGARSSTRRFARRTIDQAASIPRSISYPSIAARYSRSATISSLSPSPGGPHAALPLRCAIETVREQFAPVVGQIGLRRSMNRPSLKSPSRNRGTSLTGSSTASAPHRSTTSRIHGVAEGLESFSPATFTQPCPSTLPAAADTRAHQHNPPDDAVEPRDVRPITWESAGQ
jgi:hypothetical protein